MTSPIIPIPADDPLFVRIQAALAGRYSLAGELGRGGMGVVYLAREIRLERLVAIKVLPPERSIPALQERFLREARTAARLSHPNIVPIHSVDEDDTFTWFVMGYVDGVPLSRYLAERGPLSPQEAARILRDVAWALAYAHAQGVVHRDIKPDNILMERGSGRPLVADFGIAHLATASAVTAVGQVLGTPDYMSPEQAAGETVDARSDIYALGVVAYQALSGRLPFTGASAGAILAQHLTQPAPPLLGVAPGTPPRLAEVIDRCLRKEPAERYRSAEELAEAIDAAVERRRELPEPLQRWVTGTAQLRFRHMLLAPALLWPLLDMLDNLLSALIPGAHFREPFALNVALVLGVPFIVYAAFRFLETRQALAAGFPLADLRAALRTAIARRREQGPPPPRGATGLLSRIAGAVPGALVASIGLTTVWKCFDANDDPRGLVFPVWIAIAGGLLLARTLHSVSDADLLDLEARARLWDRFGATFTRLTGLGLRRRPLPPGTHQPTEVALHAAVEVMFDALPRELRRQLSGVPDGVRRLTERAHALREQLDRLAELERARAGPGGAGALAGEQRQALEQELRSLREEAERRLADVMTALETVRINLLRLQAGSVSVTSVSADIAMAERIGADLDAAVDGVATVERILHHETPT